MRYPKGAGLSSLLALATLATSVFWAAPALVRLSGQFAGNAFYGVVRVAVLVAFGFVAARYHRKSKFQIIGMTAAIEAVDQVIFKGMLLYSDYRGHPEGWSESGFGPAVFSLFAGFMIFFPMIVILAWVGAELASFKRFKPRYKF